MSEPDLIRSDRPHQVTLPEGANVAAGKKGEALESSVRQVLTETSGPIIEHSLQDQRVAAPDTAAEVPDRTDSPAIEQVLNDVQVLLPPSVPVEAVEVAVEIADLPEALTTFDFSTGPVVQRSEDDNLVAVPDTVQNSSLGTFDLTSHEPAEALPEIPVPEEAPAWATRPATAAELDIEPTLDTLQPMGTSERLDQLKVENDRVRSKLDALQALDPQPMHFSRH